MSVRCGRLAARFSDRTVCDNTGVVSMRSQFALRTMGVGLAALLVVSAPAAVEAAYTSTVVGTVATMTGDAAGDTLTITQSGGLFQHNRATAGDPGFNSDFDFDSATAGDQTIASASGTININAGDGNDTIALRRRHQCARRNRRRCSAPTRSITRLRPPPSSRTSASAPPG